MYGLLWLLDIKAQSTGIDSFDISTSISPMKLLHLKFDAFRNYFKFPWCNFDPLYSKWADLEKTAVDGG